MKKKGLLFGMALSLLACLCLALLCACVKKETSGKDGKSAYDIWLENGHSGTENDFLEWLKGSSGQIGTNGENGKDGLSAYELFMKYYPFYQGTEKDWMDDLISNNLELFTVTFKAVGKEDILRYAFKGQAILDVPEVPAKIGNDGVWDTTDFSNITENMTVNAVYETKGLSYALINDQQEYRVSAGTMYKNTAELFIPAMHEGKPVTVIAENAFQGDYYSENTQFKFKLAHLPESITEIRASAFYSCQQLQSIQIPDQVTTISKYAFWGCKKLKDAHLSNVKTVEQAAFSGCNSMTTVEMPQVTTLESDAFSSCSSLTTVEMPQVTAIEYEAFQYCSSLQNAAMPQVTTIGSEVFSGCTNLITVEMPQVITIGNSAFSNCTKLTTVEMPNVTTIGYSAFSDCTALKHLEIPSGVTEIANGLFNGCTSLKYVVLPSGITHIGSDIFKICNSFEAIYFKGSAEEWGSIDKSIAGEVFNEAKVYYYADPMSEENEGDYWHYDVDEATPLVWNKQA